jgi:hypothetical protein
MPSPILAWHGGSAHAISTAKTLNEVLPASSLKVSYQSVRPARSFGSS